MSQEKWSPKQLNDHVAFLLKSIRETSADRPRVREVIARLYVQANQAYKANSGPTGQEVATAFNKALQLDGRNPWTGLHSDTSYAAKSARAKAWQNVREVLDRLENEDVEPPSHTDLLVSPESLDAYLEANPLTPDPVDAETAEVLQGKYAPVLRPFFHMMNAELHANAGKGDRPGWLAMSRETAMLEIYYHVAKLQKASAGGDIDQIREHAADVANMSMMLLDVCGGFPDYEGPGEEDGPWAPGWESRISGDSSIHGATDHRKPEDNS